MPLLKNPTDEWSAKDVMKKFPDMAYSLPHMPFFQEAVAILYGKDFIIKEDMSKRMQFFCKLCNSDMNSEIAVQSHYRSGKHQKNRDKESRESGGSTQFSAQAAMWPHKSIQNLLLTSAVLPIGVKMVEEYTKNYKSYYKCILCGAHGGKDHMYKHVINQKHTDAYLKTAMELENHMITSAEREGLRKEVVSMEGLDMRTIKKFTDWKLYPTKWEKVGLREFSKNAAAKKLKDSNSTAIPIAGPSHAANVKSEDSDSDSSHASGRNKMKDENRDRKGSQDRRLDSRDRDESRSKRRASRDRSWDRDESRSKRRASRDRSWDKDEIRSKRRDSRERSLDRDSRRNKRRDSRERSLDRDSRRNKRRDSRERSLDRESRRSKRRDSRDRSWDRDSRERSRDRDDRLVKTKDSRDRRGDSAEKRERREDSRDRTGSKRDGRGNNEEGRDGRDRKGGGKIPPPPAIASNEWGMREDTKDESRGSAKETRVGQTQKYDAEEIMTMLNLLVVTNQMPETFVTNVEDERLCVKMLLGLSSLLYRISHPMTDEATNKQDETLRSIMGHVKHKMEKHADQGRLK